MAAGNVPDGKRHREHSQAEGEGHSKQPDADAWERGRQNSAAASAEDQPERSDELRRIHSHDIPHLEPPIQRDEVSTSRVGSRRRTSLKSRQTAADTTRSRNADT